MYLSTLINSGTHEYFYFVSNLSLCLSAFSQEITMKVRALDMLMVMMNFRIVFLTLRLLDFFLDNGILGLRKTDSFVGFLGQIFIDFLFGGVALMNRNIDAVADTIAGSRMSSTGFVTFNNLVGITMAVKLPLSHDPDVIKTAVAPDPRDIIWENVHVNESYSRGRAITANLCTGLGALLWSTIVASIQTISNVDHLANIPGFAWLQDFGGGQVTTFVNGYLPVVALLTIIGILPAIFKKIAYTFESRKTQSDVQNSILGRYFYYQVCMEHKVYWSFHSV